MEAELLSGDSPEIQAQEPKPLKPETATEKPNSFDIPVQEALPSMDEGKLGEMAQADPIATGDEKYFEEFLAEGSKLSDSQFQDSEIERAASNDPKPWYETAQGFDPEIKTFGGLTTGNEATAMSQAFPQGADLGSEDPVKNLGYSIERGWKMAQKSFSFTAGEAGLPGQIDVQVDLQKDIDQLPRDVSSKKLEAAINSEEPWQAVKELARSEGVQGMVALGAESVLNLGTESGAMFLPGTLALGLTRMPAPAAAFLNSLALEYSSSFMDGMRGAGVDVTDPDAIEKALQDPEFVSRLRQASWAKSIPVAAFDAITLGFGGKLAKGIYKNVIKRIGRNSLGRVTGYTAAGAGVIPPAMAVGMTGEVFGQASRQGVIAAQKGEEITAETLIPEDKFSVLAEGIGEIGGPLTGSLAFETLPGLKRELSKPAIGPMTEYLRQSGAPQTAAALEQSTQTSPVDPQKTSEAMGELAGRASVASAYAGRTDPYPETQPEAATEDAPVMPFKFSGEEGGLTDFSRLSSLIDSIISERKNEKRPTEQAEDKTQPTPETGQAQAEAKPAAKEGEPKPDQQGDEASQTSLEEPAAAPEVFKYDQAVDYIADWYLNKRRPELFREGMVDEKTLFPKEMTLEKFASESFMILNAAGIETPKTKEDALQMFAEIHKRVKAKFNYEDVEPTGGGGEPPEPDKPADITSKMSAVDFLGSAIQNLTKDDGSKPPKLKKLSGKNVSGEITIPQESQAYVDLINAMPEAPGEQDALAKAESYFRSKVSSLIRNNPKLASLDLSRVQNAARLRLQRQIRKKYQKLLRRGSLSESVAAEKFVSDVLPRVNPSRIFRSVLADYGRKLARRSNAKVGIESTVSLDKTFSEEGDLTFGDILEDKSDNEQDEQVFADIGRNARNAYFNSIQGDLAKNLLFRSAMNMRPGSDISTDAGRLRKIQDALEAAGEKVEFDKLQKLAISLMQEFREKVSAKANADYERYQSTGQLPDLVAGPESLKYLTSGRETVSLPVNREDREAHVLVDDMLEQLLGQGMITEQQAVAIQDILDENPKKTGAVAAMRELREMLAASAVTANVREPVTRVVSNNPEVNDQAPDSFILMKVQREGASMIYNAYLRGRKGVLLADTAGLGKTRTALAAARMVADHVAKQVSSLTGEELKPGKIIYITESRELIDSAAGGAKAQLVAGNIPSDRVYFKTYDDYSKGKINFEDADVIIFDEAQNLKNPESERARLSKIGNAFHIYVTATPADKIRAVRYFLPRITGRPTREVENSLEIAKDKPEVIASYLELAGENFAYIRREPVRGLPPANLVEVNLPEALVENLAQIEAFHQEKLDSLSERMLSGAITEDQANNERLGILADRKRSLERYLEMNKTEEVYTRTKEALDSGRQVLIFGEAVNPTSFPELGVNEPVASALEMLKARFEAEGIGVSVIYGEGGEAMVADINDFQKGKKTVALATPNKAGAGLNLDDQTGERPRTVINMTINEAADKDEQMRSRAGGRLSSKSDVEYLEIYAPQSATDRARKELREKKQKILRVTQGADPGTRDPNQMLIEFQGVIETNKRPVLSMPDVDPTLAPVYSDTAKTRERLNRQMVDDRLNTLRSLQRNAVQRFAQALDELGFRGIRIEFAEYSGKAAWTDWTRGSFNTIYVNPANLATSLDVVSSNENGLGELFLRAVGLEEVHHNQVYELIEKVSKNIFAKAIEEGSVSVKEAFRQTYTVMLRGVYSEMSQAMRTEIQSRYKTGKAMSPEMTAIEFLRSVYQELKLEYTTEDFNTEERRRAIARKLQGVPRDGMIRMWLELLRQSVLTLLRKAQKTFAQAPILSNMLDATDNMIQYLTDNGPPFTFTDAFAGSLVPQLRAALQIDSGVSGVITDTSGNPIQLKKSEIERLAENISTEVAKPMAAIDGVLMSGKPSSTRGLSEKVYQGQYAWVKADKLQASHLTNFAPNTKYPFLNTRDYSSSQGDQDKVLEGARNFKPEMFVTNSQSANGGLQTVMRGRRAGDFYVAAGNGRHLISQIATAKAETGRNNLRDMVDRMVELANKEGIPVPENVYEFRLVKVLDMEVDESDKGLKGEIEEIISDLNDGGGRQVSALGKSEQDLPTILGNANLKERLEKFAIGERELTSNTASEFVREAVSLKAINQLERGYLAEPAEKMSALAYVRYLLARAYSSPNIPLVVAGKNPQVVYATEVMALNDSNWAIVSGLLRTNALSEALGPKGKALRSAIDQLIYRLVTQPDETKSDFLGLLKSFRDRPDELMTLMGTEEEIETQRKMEQIGDLLETQLAKQVSRKTGKTKIDVAKSRSRMLRLIRAMGDHLYSTYKEKKEDQRGSMSLDLGDAVEDGVEYMLQVVKARIASNPAVFDQEDGDEDYDPAAASEIEGDDFEQPATSDADPDSEESRSLVDPVMSDEEMRPEKMVWQAWQAEGDVDFGFKSRTAYNRLLTYLDQAGYGKYLRFKKIINSMAADEAWVEEMGKRLDEEAEFKDLLEKASGKTVTSRMERLKMAIPTKEETFEVMRLTNVYAKDGRVAQLLEPIDKAIQYPLVTFAESRAQDEAIAMFAKAQKEVERLVKAKEYRVLRENPRFAEETRAILEEINAGYQKFLSEKVAVADIETSTESEAREKEESRQRVAKRKISEAKLPDKFSPIRLQAAIEQINRNAIQRAVATPSINDRIKGVLKSLEEVGQNLNSLSTSRETATLALLRMIEVSGGKPDFLAKKRINKNIKALEREINRHQVIEKRLLFVLEELEGIKDLSKIKVEEKVDEGKRLTKAQLEGLPQRVQKEIAKRKFKEDFPVYEGTLRWEDPRAGKGTVVAKTLSQVISKTGNTTQFNTVLVSYLTASGEVPLATYANGIPIGREDGKALASAYYAQGGKSIIVTPQIAGEAPSLSRIEPVGMFLRGDKFYTPAPEPAAPKPKVKILELPMAQRFSKDEPEVNDRGERWYEFTLDPENKRSHQRVYIRATDHLEAIRKAIAKMTDKGQTVIYKGKHYSQREPERTIRVPVNEERPETIAGLTQDELAIRKAIRMADVAKMRKLIEEGKARDEDYRWFAKQEAEATITGLYEEGRELEDSQVISLAKEFGLIDLSGDRKPDFRRLKQLRELALSRNTPKTMGVSRNVGRSGVIKDVSVNMALFGNQSSTKEVPAPEQTYKLPELPRKTSQDVLQEIADQNGTTVEDIKRVNNMSGAALAPGASLLIPGTTRSVKVPDYNLVQEGPSLFKIAKKFGITREELAKANNFPEDYILKPGDELFIPATKFKDTTKELVDRLFKERVYEAGPTMLRVNTPPPGVRIVNQDGEPAAATTIEPDEERKIELLKTAELPGKAKTAVEKSFEKGESFMEALTKLGEVLKELKRDNPELFREQNNRLETELPSAATEIEKPIWAESRKVSRQKHTYFLTLRPYGTEVTEAYGRKESIGKNLFKLFRKNGSVVYNGRRYTQNQIGLLTYLINNNRGWADPVRRIDYNEDGSINAPVAASEVEPSGEEAERIYRARRMSQKKEGKQKVRGFVRTYGNDGEIDKDLRDAAALSSIRYHVRTQPLRAEEAMELVKKGGGAVAVARELIAPETDNQEIAAISNNPIEFDNLVILNTILIKQLDKTHKAAKALGNNATAAEAMNLSLQLVGKQAVLGTRLGRGLAAFAAYSRLSPAGWRYFLTQQFEQARLEQINLLPEQFQKIATGANASVAEAFEKVINKPEIKTLLDKIDELANTKVWEDLLKRAKRVNRIAREAKGKDEAKRAKELEKIIADTKELLAMIKRQSDERSALQMESALSEGIAAALMRGVKSPEETAQKLGVTKEEVLENVEPAQDKLDEVRQESTDTLRDILPPELRNKPMNWLFDNEEPAAAATPEESIEDGDSVEDELAEADELQADKMLKKFLKDFGKSLRDRDKTESLPQEKVNAIVRRILRENMQKANPELSLKRSRMSAKDRQTRAFTRFRKALSIWQELGEASGDSAFVESVTTALNKMLPPGQAEVVLAALNEALEQPYTKADLKAFLTIKNSNIRDFLFSRRYQLYELQAEIVDTLAAELRANGLSVDPEMLSNVLQAIAKDLETTAQEELLKTFKQKEYARLPKLKVFQESTNELVRLALLQKLDPTSLFETLATKLKLDEKSWSPSEQVLEKIQQKAEMVANDPDGPNSRRSIQNTLELLDIIRKEVGFSLLDVTQAFFYANIIGGIKTIGTNIFAPVMNAIHFGFTAASGKARRQGLSYAMQRIRQAFNQGLAEFLSVMATGNIAGKVTFLESMTGTVGQRKTGRQNLELFLEDDARFYSRLPAFGWLVPLAKFWYGIGKETPKLSVQIGLPKSIWDKAFSILKTKPVKKLLGNVRTPQYPDSGVKVHVSIAGLGALIGRLYSGLDVFWTAVYSEIQAAVTAHEIAYEKSRAAARAEGSNAPEGSAASGLDLENIRFKADALMGYDMGSKLRAARLITRNKTAENTEGRDVPEYNELAQQLRAQAEEERLEGLKRGTLEYRQQFYLNRIRSRVYSDQLPEEKDIRERMKRRDKLSEKEKASLDKAIQARNEKVNRLVWESLFMGQWMAQVNEPYGLIGKASKLMENIVKRQGFRLLAFVQPFFSIVANVYTIWLNWMGFGYLKNAGGLGKNIEVYGEPKKEKPEALREYERSAGLVGGLTLLFGALMMVAIRHFGDDDDDEEGKKKDPWFSISGRGPEDINQRKALEATGKWQRDSFKFGNTWIKNPVYSPTYLVFKALGDIGDYLKYDVPTHSGLLDLGMNFIAKFIGAAVRGPLDVPFVSGLKTAMDAVNTENPNWISSAGGLLSRTTGGILVPGIARELDQRVIDPTVRQKSGGLLATLLGNLPFMRSFNKPMTNVFGEPVKFNNPPQGSPVNALSNYLEIFMTQRAEVDPLFEVLMAKQAWITLPPNRVSVLGVVLNEDLADEWKMKRAEYLREEFRREDAVTELWEMSPAEAQAYTNAHTQAANRTADAFILEKYPEIEESAGDMMERKAMYGPRGVK